MEQSLILGIKSFDSVKLLASWPAVYSNPTELACKKYLFWGKYFLPGGSDFRSKGCVLRAQGDPRLLF